MDVQLVLLVTLSLLTINLVVVGIYVIMVLREFRDTMKKLNGFLDTVQTVTDSVTAPISTLSNVFAGVTSGLKVLNAFKSLKREQKEEK